MTEKRILVNHVFSQSKIILHNCTYLIISHETPCKNADLLIEWYLVYTTWQVSTVTVNNVLEVLAKADIERFQIYLSLYNLEQTIELVYCQVFNNSLRHSCDLLLIGILRQCLVDKVRINLLKRGVTTVDQVSEILDRRRLVLNQDEDEM